MQNKIKLVTKGFIALLGRKQGALNNRLYTTAKGAKIAIDRHIEKEKEARKATEQVRKEAMLNDIIKGASLLHTIAEKLQNAKKNLKMWGYSFARLVLVFKLRKAYNSALYSA